MKFLGGKKLLEQDEYGGAFGTQIENDPDRPLALIDVQHVVDDKRLAWVRAWFREVHRDELEQVGTMGRRFSYEGREYLLDESQGPYMDPANSAVELFFVDGDNLRFLKPRVENTAAGLTDAVVGREVPTYIAPRPTTEIY